jgi:hypothetical protein
MFNHAQNIKKKLKIGNRKLTRWRFMIYAVSSMQTFTFTPNRYVLAAQAHPPGITNDFLNMRCSTFTLEFSADIATDEAAIATAQESLSRHRESARKSGKLVDATLHFHDAKLESRIVKSFQDQE